MKSNGRRACSRTFKILGLNQSLLAPNPGHVDSNIGDKKMSRCFSCNSSGECFEHCGKEPWQLQDEVDQLKSEIAELTEDDPKGMIPTVHIYTSSHVSKNKIKLLCTGEWVDAENHNGRPSWSINGIPQTTQVFKSDCRACILKGAKKYKCDCNKVTAKLLEVIEGKYD